MGIVGNGVVGVGFQRIGASAVHVEGADNPRLNGGLIAIEGVGGNTVGLTEGHGGIVGAEARPVMVGAVEHILPVMLRHHAHAVGSGNALHHVVGALDKALGGLVGIIVPCGGLKGGALGDKKAGGVDVGILGGKFAHGRGISRRARRIGSKILNAVVAADQYGVGIVGIQGVVIVLALHRLGDDAAQVVGGVAALPCGDVLLPCGHHLLPTHTAHAVRSDRMAEGRAHLSTTHGADFGGGTGSRPCGSVGKLGGQHLAAAGTGLRCRTGGLRTCFMA